MHTETSLHYLVVVYEVLQLISMNNDVKTTVLGETELFIIDTRETNFLPRPRAGEEMNVRDYYSNYERSCIKFPCYNECETEG